MSNMTFQAFVQSLGNASALTGAEVVPLIQSGNPVQTPINALPFSFIRTPAEVTAGVTPTNFTFLPGDVRRYGAVLDGVTNDTAALTNWAKVGGNLTWPVPQTALITANIPLVSNSTITFCKGGGLTTATGNISMLKASAKTNINIFGGTYTQTSGGATGVLGLVHFDTCTFSSMQYGEFVGAQWSGVLLDNCTECDVFFNYLHGAATGTPGDQNDIAVYHNSSNCRVGFNRCYGGNFYGVLCQDPGGLGASLPQKNKIHNNWIKGKTGYGVAVYIGAVGTVDSFNDVVENDIQDITGASNGGILGSGVYVVGAGAGGTSVLNNKIRNCCTGSTSRTNAPGHISITGLAANGAPVVVEGNVLDCSAFFDGILSVSNLGTPVVINGNTIRFPAGNVTGDPIRIESSLNTTVSNNIIRRSTDAGRIIMAFANGSTAAVLSGLVISGNQCVGGHDRQIDFVAASGGTFANVVVDGNVVTGGASGAIPINLLSIDMGVVSNNVCSTLANFAMFLSACTNTRVTGNALKTTGTNGFGSGGVCTGSYFDKSNLPGPLIQNTATGLICEQLGNAAPASASSNGAVGDRVEQSVPVVGNPKGWRCTVAGNPGTWVSEGAL